MRANLIAVADWLGHHGEPLHPEAMQYTTSPAKSCRGCVFDGQRASVCERACQAAERAGLERCDRADVIYLPKPIDPRQIPIPGAG